MNFRTSIASLLSAAAIAYCDGFVAEWTLASGAVATRLRVEEIVNIPEQCESLAAWDFSAMTNSSGNVANIENGFSERWPGLSGQTLRAPANSCGVVQIGVNDRAGQLKIERVPHGAEHLIVRATIRNQKGNRYMAMDCLDETGATNATQKILVAGEFADYAFPVSGTSTASLAIHSTNKDYPLLVESLRFVKDLVAAHTATNDVASVDAPAPRRHWAFRGLHPGEYLWRRADIMPGDTPPVWSDTARIELSPDAPRMPRPLNIIFR